MKNCFGRRKAVSRMTAIGRRRKGWGPLIWSETAMVAFGSGWPWRPKDEHRRGDVMAGMDFVCCDVWKLDGGVKNF